MRRGERDGFFWLVSADHTLGDLVDTCPELFVGRSVAVTSFDSGPLTLTPEDLDSGWEPRDDLAIAPQGLDPSQIPFDNFDEWYVFDGQVPDFGSFERFVSFVGFSLVPPEAASLQEATPDDAAAREHVRNVEILQARFWDQLQRLQPTCYVADGNLLTIVTKSEGERNRVWDALAAE